MASIPSARWPACCAGPTTRATGRSSPTFASSPSWPGPTRAPATPCACAPSSTRTGASATASTTPSCWPPTPGSTPGRRSSPRVSAFCCTRPGTTPPTRAPTRRRRSCWPATPPTAKPAPSPAWPPTRESAASCRCTSTRCTTRPITPPSRPPPAPSSHARTCCRTARSSTRTATVDTLGPDRRQASGGPGLIRFRSKRFLVLTLVLAALVVFLLPAFVAFRYTAPSQRGDFIRHPCRRIDEGEHSRKTVNVVDNEVCYACPLEDECTPAIKAKHLKKDVCLWREMGAVLDDDYDKLRDARRLYRSKEDDAGPVLDASLDASLDA